MTKAQRPKLTKEEREARSAAWTAKRQAAADRRAAAEIRDRKAKAIRDGAAARLRAIRREEEALGITAATREAARISRLAAAAKRERFRVNTLVLGNKPDAEPSPKKPSGMSKAEWKVEKARLRKEASVVTPAEAWRGFQGTPETLKNAALHTDSLIQMERNGSITKDQVEWMAQIANVYRSIEADVAVTVASFEAHVDQSRRSAEVAERVHRVRMHRAYAIWRDMLPAPKALALDMIVGDAIGYTVAARRHRVHNRRAKRVLIDAIDCWPLCVARAFSIVDQSMVDAMNEAVAPRSPAVLNDAAPAQPVNYELARAIETGRERTDEPYLLPAVDPAFLDARGYLLPWDAISAIVRERVAEMALGA